MAGSIEKFTKRREYLICVDSDGCAMDTMDIKHIRCFGPCMVDEWRLGEWCPQLLERWNEINLYSMTRGVNRFKGLAMILREIDVKYCRIDDLEALEAWADTAPELSNGALTREIAEKDKRGENHVSLKKALSWSEAVNRAISELKDNDKKPFDGVAAALEEAHRRADVAVVSSANLDAVAEEWKRYGLLEHTDAVLAQDCGSKAYCIGELLKKGYEKDHVLMCGDAPGDLSAARENGVLFYPILVRHEAHCWKEFPKEGLAPLMDGTYGEVCEREKIQAFIKNLGG